MASLVPRKYNRIHPEDSRSETTSELKQSQYFDLWLDRSLKDFAKGATEDPVSSDLVDKIKSHKPD